MDGKGLAYQWAEQYGDAVGCMGIVGFAAFAAILIAFICILLGKRKKPIAMMGIVFSFIALITSLAWRFWWVETGSEYFYKETMKITLIVAVSVAVLSLLFIIIGINRTKRLSKSAVRDGAENQIPQSRETAAVNQELQQTSETKPDTDIESVISTNDDAALEDEDDLSEIIDELIELKEAGILSEDEFEQKKKEIFRRI